MQIKPTRIKTELPRLKRDLTAPKIDPAGDTKKLKAFAARLPKAEHARVGRYKRQGRA